MAFVIQETSECLFESRLHRVNMSGESFGFDRSLAIDHMARTSSHTEPIVHGTICFVRWFQGSY